MPSSIAVPEVLRGRRVLVVDDNDVLRRALQAQLESLHFDVAQAASGAQALEALRQAQAQGQPFEVVLLDWLMPGQKGTETAAHIARLGLQPRPHCILVTGHGREEVLHGARRVGVSEVLLKPVSRSTLFDTLLGLLGPCNSVVPAAEPAMQAALDLSPLRGARVLLVDDMRMNQEVGRGLLQAAGMQVELADNGQQALEMLQRGPFDVVLMDLDMPVLGGLEATRAIRSQPALDAMPVIALSANDPAAERAQCLAAGMADYVAKPIVPEQLWIALLKQLPAAGPRTTQPRN